VAARSEAPVCHACAATGMGLQQRLCCRHAHMGTEARVLVRMWSASGARGADVGDAHGRDADAAQPLPAAAAARRAGLPAAGALALTLN